MRVFNENKTEELKEYDLNTGYLKPDTLAKIVPEVREVKEQGHYEIIREYPNGGKDKKWIVDVKGVKYQPIRTITEDIYVYIPYTVNDIINNNLAELRNIREKECFPIINRGQFWYNSLTSTQVEELNTWYNEWLDITKKYSIDIKDINAILPEKPIWLK